MSKQKIKLKQYLEIVITYYRSRVASDSNIQEQDALMSGESKKQSVNKIVKKVEGVCNQDSNKCNEYVNEVVKDIY